MVEVGPRKSGLCGWFGAFDSDASPPQALARMASTIGGAASRKWRTATHEGALQLVPGTTSGDFFAGDGLMVAIDGYPLWSEPELAGIAAEHGQARALAEAYRRFGRRLLEHLHGPFVMVVLDTAGRCAVLANDRLGIYSLYFERTGSDSVLFATTADAIAGHPSVHDTIAPQAVFSFLCFDHVPAPMTIYAEQEKLLAGQFLEVGARGLRTDFYWQMSYGAEQHADRTELRAALYEALRGAIGHTVAGEDGSQVGTFLSGGLDSSTVLGLLTEALDRPVKAFTIGFDHKGYDESEYAEAAARHFGGEHVVRTVTPKDVFDLIPLMAKTYDEPFANSSAVPAYYCAASAREHGVDVLLAGDGGDELFAGNKHYLRMKIFEAYHRFPAALRRKVIEPVVFGISGWESFGLVRKARRYISQANTPMPERSAQYEATLASRLHQVMSRRFVEGIDSDLPLSMLRDHYERAGTSSLVQRMMYLDLQTVLADNDLRKVDRMCALAGVRVRFPMLDEGVVELSGGIPPRLQLPGLKLRDFFRRAMQDFLPEGVLKKSKHGFALPYGSWIKEYPPLKELTLDSLAATKRRGYVCDSYVESVTDEFMKNDHPVFSGPIWNLMLLELWMEHHVDNRNIPL